jgi:hypothetical protein
MTGQARRLRVPAGRGRFGPPNARAFGSLGGSPCRMGADRSWPRCRDRARGESWCLTDHIIRMYCARGGQLPRSVRAPTVDWLWQKGGGLAALGVGIRSRLGPRDRRSRGEAGHDGAPHVGHDHATARSVSYPVVVRFPEIFVIATCTRNTPGRAPGRWNFDHPPGRGRCSVSWGRVLGFPFWAVFASA